LITPLQIQIFHETYERGHRRNSFDDAH
jgi:hypothetical protein